MKKNPYKEAPANFSVCVHTDCTCGSTCLRQLWLIRYCWKEKLFYIWPILPDALKNFHARITVMPLP